MVTGANGHVGYNLVRILAARGNSVRATVRNRDDPRTAGPIEALDNVAVESLDVCDAQRFESISKGVDTLFHLAATYKFHTSASSDDEQMVRDSVEGASSHPRRRHKRHPQGGPRLLDRRAATCQPGRGEADRSGLEVRPLSSL